MKCLLVRRSYIHSSFVHGDSLAGFRSKNSTFAFPPNGDPDGPFAGGLDDISDWGNLLSFIGNLLLIPGGLITLSYSISVQKGLINYLWNLLMLYFFVYGVFAGLTDAFDLRDPDYDGR